MWRPKGWTHSPRGPSEATDSQYRPVVGVRPRGGATLEHPSLSRGDVCILRGRIECISDVESDMHIQVGLGWSSEEQM